MKQIVHYMNRIFPDSNNLGQFGEETAANYPYSVWLGITQPIINLPRVIVLGIWSSLVIIGLGIFTGLMTLLTRAIISPIVDTITVMKAGFLGKLTRVDDPQWQESYKRRNGEAYRED